MKTLKFFWTTHKWAGIILAIIFLNIAVTGVLLLFKKKVDWIQPPTQRGVAENEFAIGFDEIVAICRDHPELGVETWADVDRLDVRPGKGMLKVRAVSGWEAQIDLVTGEVLQVAYRRSDLIESIHDGSFFGDWAYDWVWPVSGVSLVFLAFSGYWIWLEPKYRRSKRKRAREAKTQ